MLIKKNVCKNINKMKEQIPFLHLLLNILLWVNRAYGLVFFKNVKHQTVIVIP